MSLALQRWRAVQEIDALAGEVRLAYISDLTGQTAVYQVKLQEARDYLAAVAIDGNSVPGPHVAAEAARRGKTALHVATEVNDRGSFWLSAPSPEIEAERVGGKEDVRECEDTAQAIDAALQACLAALNALRP